MIRDPTKTITSLKTKMDSQNNGLEKVDYFKIWPNVWYPFSIFGCRCRTTVDFKSVADTPTRIRTNKTTT